MCNKPAPLNVSGLTGRFSAEIGAVGLIFFWRKLRDSLLDTDSEPRQLSPAKLINTKIENHQKPAIFDYFFPESSFWSIIIVAPSVFVWVVCVP